jgi:Trypsin Inhibitor like cysteine rich domain
LLCWQLLLVNMRNYIAMEIIKNIFSQLAAIPRTVSCILLLLNIYFVTFIKITSTVSCPGVNEEYTTCGSGCGDSDCSDPNNIARICPAVCREGCFCKQGYVRQNGVCILIEDCPANPTCPANEQYDECYNPCPPTCDKPDQPPCPTFACSPGCSCQSGFIRNAAGTCIPLNQCPKRCSANEVAVRCANPCQPTCKLPYRQPCPTFACIPGCACKTGYLRNSSGQCILRRRCPRF